MDSRDGTVAAFELSIFHGAHVQVRLGDQLEHGCQYPDPIAMAHAIDPEPATSERLGVDIAIGPNPMRGAMIVDHYGFGGFDRNAEVVIDYPEERFFELLLELLGTAPSD